MSFVDRIYYNRLLITTVNKSVVSIKKTTTINDVCKIAKNVSESCVCSEVGYRHFAFSLLRLSKFKENYNYDKVIKGLKGQALAIMIKLKVQLPLCFTKYDTMKW